ncbi:glycosyltransferase family 2 protein [Mariniflexile sp.]|uniref:glycosyltransferase family 2 protein n=1 Tax=Mariniflexile sp. TaxID=1979402 RepID=UPI003566BF84
MILIPILAIYLYAMSEPLISVIVPNYNHARFLEQRLESIFNQSYQHIEVILLDDCSTDTSQSILLEYSKHPKVSHCLFNETNSGSPFKQWQKGIELAKGCYIWIAESDDNCELNFLEQLLKLFDDKRTVLAYCASTVINNQGEKLGRHTWADALDSKRWTNSFLNRGKDEIKRFIRYRNAITNASAVVFKKSAIMGVHYPIHMKFCGDWYIWIEILKQGNIAYDHNELNYFRRHLDSTKTVKTFHLENQRISEYLEIFLANSSFFSRLLNRNKYLWVLNEWHEKKRFFPKKTLKELGFPVDFLMFFRLKEKK